MDMCCILDMCRVPKEMTTTFSVDVKKPLIPLIGVQFQLYYQNIPYQNFSSLRVLNKNFCRISH